MKIICYLAYGYPTIEKSLEIATTYIESGCDMIEISLPTDNPYLEPEFLAEKNFAALKQCNDYNVYLEKLCEFAQSHAETAITLLAYEHVLEKIGTGKIVDFMQKSSIKDLIYAGNVKHPEIKSELMNQGIKISSPVSFQMTEEELDGAVSSNGFVYMEGKPQRGTKAGFETLNKCIEELRRLGITRPIYCGVGMR
ncbi:MAG: tryptophan synthase subunit alpha, partial [Oscillospiraceae bacterium]